MSYYPNQNPAGDPRYLPDQRQPQYPPHHAAPAAAMGGIPPQHYQHPPQYSMPPGGYPPQAPPTSYYPHQYSGTAQPPPHHHHHHQYPPQQQQQYPPTAPHYGQHQAPPPTHPGTAQPPPHHHQYPPQQQQQYPSTAPHQQQYPPTTPHYGHPGTAATHPGVALSASVPVPAVLAPTVQWVPSADDGAIIDGWFYELDKEKRGLVGGIDIAMFLKRSNLTREILRTIWSLIDNTSAGFVNKDQFTNIIRLVSISCSPIYMGAQPTLERLKDTLLDTSISLPTALLQQPSVSTTAAVSLSPSSLQPAITAGPAAAAAVGTSSVIPSDSFSSTDPPPATAAAGISNMPQDDDEDEAFSDFAAAPSSDKMDAFADLLAPVDDAPLPSLTAGLATSSSSSSSSSSSGGGGGDVGGMPIDTSQPPLPVPLQQPGLAAAGAAGEGGAGDSVEDDDFGDFESHTPPASTLSANITPVASSTSLYEQALPPPPSLPPPSLPPQTIAGATGTAKHQLAQPVPQHPPPIPPVLPPQQVQHPHNDTKDVNNTGDEDDDDDFGDFETHTPPPSSLTPTLSAGNNADTAVLPTTQPQRLGNDLQQRVPGAVSSMTSSTSISTGMDNTRGDSGGDDDYNLMGGITTAASSALVDAPMYPPPAPAPPSLSNLEEEVMGALSSIPGIGIGNNTATSIALVDQQEQAPIQPRLGFLRTTADTTNASVITVSAAISPDDGVEHEQALGKPTPAESQPLGASASTDPVTTAAEAAAAEAGGGEAMEGGDALVKSDSNLRISAFDELVENDLKALDEDWDDFTGGSETGIPSSGQIDTTTATTSDNGIVSTMNVDGYSIDTSVGNEVASVGQIQQTLIDSNSIGNYNSNHDDHDEGFGDFREAQDDSAAVSTQIESLADTVPEAAAAAAAADSGAIATSTGTTSNAAKSIDEMFAESQFQSTHSNHDEDHEYSNNNISVSVNAAQGGTNEEIILGASTSLAAGSGERGEEEDDDFGDFESHAPPPEAQQSNIEHPTILPSSSSSSSSLPPIPPSVPAPSTAPAEAAAAIAMVTTLDQSSLPIMHSDYSVNDGNNAVVEVAIDTGNDGSASGVDVDSDNLFFDMGASSSFAPSGTSNSASASAGPDLLDFLSEPVSDVATGVSTTGTTASGVPSATHITAFDDPFNQPAVEEFGDFGSFESGENINPPAAPDHATKTDLFGDPSPPPPPPPATAVTAPVVSTSASSNSVNSRSNTTHQALSLAQLQDLCIKLTTKHYYEDAFNCLQQAKLVQKIQLLSAQKMAAVEADDLESAMILKREIVSLSHTIQSAELEMNWAKRGASVGSGESLQETADLINAIDAAMGAKFRERFLLHPLAEENEMAVAMTGEDESSSQPQQQELRLRHCIIAKRSARMILSLCSTHSHYPQQWLKMLQVVANRVKEGNNMIYRFDQLSKADQMGIRTDLKISEYSRGLVSIAEVGIWIATSCIEAFAHEQIAMNVLASCQELIKFAEDRWGMGSRLKSVSIDEITVEAARLSEHKSVQYCAFTLRPLQYVLSRKDGADVKTDTIKLYDHTSSHRTVGSRPAYFMEPAIKLWLNDVSKSMPQCEASFT